MPEKLEDIVYRRISRRDILKSAAFIALGAILPKQFFALPLEGMRDQSGLFFTPINASDADELILPEGFNYTIVRKWGDKISPNGIYGYNNDFAVYLPIDLQSGGKNSNDGLMFVNHEYPDPMFVSDYSNEDYRAGKIKTEEQILKEKLCVGISIFRVKKINGKWKFTEDDNYARRIDALTKITLSGKAAGTPEMSNSYEAFGTMANCSGGVTPWGTVLSGEENFQDYTGEKGYRWNDGADKLIKEHYGWMVEANPFDKNSPVKKRTSLGRFRHENICVHIAPDGRAVAYMGDDKEDECVYKFITKNKFDSNDIAANYDILDEGDLYAADFTNNNWLLLDYDSSVKLKQNFKSQADVLINCDNASAVIGATPCNRCEDIEINKIDGSVFLAFTNNKPKNDYHGSIIRIVEKNNDHASLEFTWEVFAAGGVEAGFSCPDNLHFDSKGNLWVMSDISPGKIGKDMYTTFKNNSLFMIPTGGKDKGKAFRFAAGPVDTEMCGMCFSPDEKTMFLSIQHPGENSPTAESPTSRWPNFGNDIPRPALVAITGFKK
jgi:uncharacterized protein